MKMTHPPMGFPPVNQAANGSQAYPCKGMRLQGGGTSPSNVYHPAQKAWLVEKKLYTGRFIADVGHLPDNLRNL